MNNHVHHNMLYELEAVVQNLTRELHLLKSECETSKSRITMLLTENKELSEKIIELADIYQQELTKKRKPEESELVENLQKQIECLKVEKESVVHLWQTSVKSIDCLEQELKQHRHSTEGFVLKTEVEKIKRDYEERIKVLEEQLAENQRKHNQVIETYATKLEAKCLEVESFLEEKAEGLKKSCNLESQLEELRSRLDCAEKDKINLEKIMKDKDKEIQNLQYKLVVSRSKISEAIDVAESAISEKNDALARETSTKDELASVSKSISDVVREALENSDKEINAVRSEYQEKLAELNQLLKNTQEELKKEKSELQKYILKCEILEGEVELNKKGNEHFTESSSSKIMHLEKNLEATFQKLLLSEKQNLQLTAERENIKRDLEQMANHFERDIKQREVERRTMQYEIETLQKVLNGNERKMSELNATLRKMQAELRHKNLEQRNMKAKLIEKSTQKCNEVEAVGERVYQELYTQLEQQIALSKKWKNEAYSIQEKFEEKLKEMKRYNLVLKNKLSEAENKLCDYMCSFKTICSSVNKIADATCTLYTIFRKNFVYFSDDTSKAAFE